MQAAILWRRVSAGTSVATTWLMIWCSRTGCQLHWRRVFTGAGFATLGRHSFVKVFGDCRCHDEVHRTQHYFSHEEGADVHDVRCQPAGCSSSRPSKGTVRWLRTTIRMGSSISIGFRQRHVVCLRLKSLSTSTRTETVLPMNWEAELCDRRDVERTFRLALNMAGF